MKANRNKPGPVARLRQVFDRGAAASMVTARPSTAFRDRGKGRAGNGGHRQLTTLHAGIVRAELRRQKRAAAGRWAP